MESTVNPLQVIILVDNSKILEKVRLEIALHEAKTWVHNENPHPSILGNGSQPILQQ